MQMPNPTLPTATTTMRAVLQRRYGGPEVLELGELPVPTPGPGEALVRVRASSLNYGDIVSLTGTPYLARLVFGLLRPKSLVPGMDLAGEVVSLGPDAARFQPGDAVFAESPSMGAFAEFVCVPEARLALKPTRASFEEAASLPVAGIPALQGLRDAAGVQPGHRVVINGASGGVGTFAVQIAKALGAEVTAVCSSRNAALVRSIGADHVVDYTREDFTATRERYDAVLDLVGSASISACRSVLAPAGTYVSSVGRAGWAIRAALTSLRPRAQVRVLAAESRSEDLTRLAELVDAGAIRPVIEDSYALDALPAALREQARGRTRGKRTIGI